MKASCKIAVLGAGSFGSAISHVLAEEGADVVLWGRDAAVIDEINHKKSNCQFLHCADPLQVVATTDIDAALTQAGAVVFAIPCQAQHDFLRAIKEKIPCQSLLVNLAKGVELDTFFRPAQIFSDVLGQSSKSRYAIISGPTFAGELCLKMPSAAVVASAKKETALRLQQILSTRWFRLYSSTDVVGVELGGALKNIMAIAVGIADGLGFGQNTRAGLMTRCLAEMMRVGIRLGAKAETFSGLSGIGDLILTCTGDMSRNRQVGVRLGRGEGITEIRRSMTHVAEGIPTAKAVYKLCRKLKLDVPNITHVYKILYEGLSPREAATRLMKRNLKFEF